MTDTFNFRVNSDASGEGEFVLSKAKFGDGYEQEIEHGINAEKQAWSNTFSGYHAQAEAVVAFLRSHKAVPFFWTPPLGTQGYYKCRKYRITPQGAGYYLVNMDFEQVYAP